MLDIKFIRENKDLIKDGARKKHLAFDVDALLVIDDKRRDLMKKVEDAKAEQNKYSTLITSALDNQTRLGYIDQMKVVKESAQNDEKELTDIMKEWQKMMVAVPNIPDMSVPEGDSDEQNVEVRQSGSLPQFNFTPKNHIDIMLEKNMADFDRGAKVSGFRGYFLKNDGALLSFAIWQFVMDFLAKQNYQPMIVPSLVKRETLIGTGYIPQGEEDLYKTQDNEYLAGTGEVSTMSYYSDEIIEKSQLPIKFVSFSPCFRREAGSHGKNTKGLYRVHEFFKIEQLVLCEASHQESVRLHEEVTANAEQLLQALEIPYHVVLNCGGDLGLGQVKKYDIEAWMPSENKYGETHSASYFHDFQTRRLNIRYRDDDGKLRFVHSLNNTAIATPRFLISLIENNQQADGSIRIPPVLRPYMGGREFIK
ncbi:MAG: serine--tRNA ligase [bacterium]